MFYCLFIKWNGEMLFVGSLNAVFALHVLQVAELLKVEAESSFFCLNLESRFNFWKVLVCGSFL
jgi:hypothetical protein